MSLKLSYLTWEITTKRVILEITDLKLAAGVVKRERGGGRSECRIIQGD